MGAPKQAVGAHSAWPCVANRGPKSRCRSGYEFVWRKSPLVQTLHFHRTALKRAKMTSITSGVGVHLGSILGPWRRPHFGRPSRVSATGDPPRATDLAACDFGARQDGRNWAPRFYFPILELKTRPQFRGPNSAPCSAGPDLIWGPKWPELGHFWAIRAKRLAPILLGPASPKGAQNQGVVLAMNLISINHILSRSYIFIGRP